jgi:hypothetical protein
MIPREGEEKDNNDGTTIIGVKPQHQADHVLNG